jgi:uncharacterized protein
MKKISLNYIYYSLIFAFLLSFTILNLLSIHQLNSSKFFFLIYSIGQIFLEITLIVVIIHLSGKYLTKFLHMLVVGFTFIFFFTHIFDFFLNRILDLTFVQTLSFVIDESFTNLIEMLHASGIPLFIWITGSLLFSLTPFLGYLVYKLCEKISNKAPLLINIEKIYQTLFCIPFALVIWDLNAAKILNANDYNIYLKLLPWNRTFFTPKTISITTRSSLKPPKSEKTIVQTLEKKKYIPLHKPNIYLFIAESLRDDFITKENSPHLHDFKSENISFPVSLSNANDTTNGWFPIFHSIFPYHKTCLKKAKWKIGSPALYYLQKIGYETHVYSSAALAYYGMEELIFGEERFITKTFNSFPHYHPIKAYESDEKTIEAFQKTIAENKKSNGQIHIFFLDATHFDYSYPEKTFTKHLPTSADLSFFKVHPSTKDLEKMKNRYRNSIYYIDSLFKKFINTLKDNNLYEDSVIIFTADHGEEFMEKGHMFHCSELTKEQTTVPIFYKFGNNKSRTIYNKSMTCQVEIFPSILDYLFGENLFKDVFDGNSIFDQSKWPYVLTVRYNASRAPYEFFFHNGQKKLVLRFKNQKDIFSSKELQVIGIKDPNDNYIYYKPNDTQSIIEKEFSSAIDKIFH